MMRRQDHARVELISQSAAAGFLGSVEAVHLCSSMLQAFDSEQVFAKAVDIVEQTRLWPSGVLPFKSKLCIKGNRVEYWECKSCNALTSTSLNACWHCNAIKGSKPSAEEIAAARERERDLHPRVGSLAFHQVLLLVAAGIFAAMTVAPIYCFAAYLGDCPLETPELKYVYLAASPFFMVVADMVVIYFIAPTRVPIELAEKFLHNGRPKFLCRWYTKLLIKSYKRN